MVMTLSVLGMLLLRVSALAADEIASKVGGAVTGTIMLT